jgi:carbon-monoxide dehydrogenase large subunit
VLGDQAKTDAIFAKAPRIIGLDIINSRIIANYLEPRALVAEPQEGGSWRVTLGSQGVHGIRNTLAKFIFKIDPATLRVVITITAHSTISSFSSGGRHYTIHNQICCGKLIK